MIIIIFFIKILTFAYSPQIPQVTLIQGRVEHGECERLTIYVADYGIKNEMIDVVNGSFSYELKTNPAVVATITCGIDGKEINQPIIPDGSKITLRFTPNGVNLKSSKRKSVNYRLAEVDKVYRESKDLIFQALKLRRSGASKELIDSVESHIHFVNERLNSLYLEDLEGQKDNYLSVQGFVGLKSQFSDEQQDSLINTLTPSVIQTTRIQSILKDIQNRLKSKVGMPFVDFSVDTENGIVRLSDYVGKGKYVLADFWASWCQPCLAEMPHIKELFKKYNGEKFTVLGIACYDDPKASQASIDSNSLPWPQILGTGNIAMEAYGISAIPDYVLFGPDGTIVFRGLRGEALDAALENELGGKN